MQDTLVFQNLRFLPVNVYYFKEFLGNQDKGGVLLRTQHQSALGL